MPAASKQVARVLCFFDDVGVPAAFTAGIQGLAMVKISEGHQHYRLFRFLQGEFGFNAGKIYKVEHMTYEIPIQETSTNPNWF